MSERIEEERLLQSLEGFEKLIATADATTFISASRRIRYCDILRGTRKRIMSLYARVEALEAAKSWISVKDRLPERPENWPHCEIKRCYFLVALESGCVKSLGFDFADMRWHTTGSPVTHWMPLPEPPKEEP